MFKDYIFKVAPLPNEKPSYGKGVKSHAISALIILVAFFTACFKLPEASAAYKSSRKVITIAADYRCPYNCDDEGEDPGFIIELLSRSLHIYGIEIEYKLMPWHEALEALDDGKIEGVIGFIPDQGKNLVRTSMPLENSSLRAFTRNDTTWVFDGINSLQSKKLGFVMDYHMSDNINSYILMNFPSDPGSFKIEDEYGALVESIANLIDGESEVYIDDKRVVNYYLYNNGLDSYVRDAGCVSKDDMPIHLYIDADFPQSRLLIKRIEEGIASLKATGEYDDLRHKYSMDKEYICQMP